MALQRNERYPGRFSNPSDDHPQGPFKNRTAPEAQDGTYLEADWANDWDGFFARLLTKASVTPNGTVDTGLSSQYYDAMVTALKADGMLSGTVPIANGGTGATTAADARTNLGLGSLSTLSTVPIANGGTGATTAADARTNLGLGSLATASTVSLYTGITGILGVEYGGTGANNAGGARTNLGVPGLSTALLSTTGWWKDDSTGLIYQWGRDATTTAYLKTVYFPMMFPNAILSVVACPYADQSTSTTQMSVYYTSVTTLSTYQSSMGTAMRYFAIGY